MEKRNLVKKSKVNKISFKKYSALKLWVTPFKKMIYTPSKIMVKLGKPIYKNGDQLDFQGNT